MIKLHSLKISFLFLVLVVHVNAQTSKAIYQDATAPIEKRVANLLKRMTIEEKAAQLRTFLDGKGKNFNENISTDTLALRIVKDGLGLLQPIETRLRREVASKNTIQKYFVEKTRLGIPVLFAAECCHGYVALEATSFPNPNSLGSTWNPGLVREIYKATAAEARSRGAHLSFTPVIDLLRDPRLGRNEELYSEDVYLTTQIGGAAVEGLQGGVSGKVGKLSVGATLKHFAGHGQAEGAINRGNVNLSEDDMRNNHLKAFQDIIRDSKPVGVMPSYNAYNGVYAHMNPWLLRDVLRKEWKFQGIIASDWSGITRLHRFNNVSEDVASSAKMALVAGVELDQASGENYKLIPQLVKKNPELIKYVDQAVNRILSYKFELGLFENPYITEDGIAQNCNLPGSKQLAYEAAAQGIVLLKNENNILPLAETQFKNIALIGAQADNMVLGGCSGFPLERKTLLSSLTKKLEGKATVHFSRGFQIFTNYPKQSYGVLSATIPIVPTTEESAKMLKEAVETAKESDAIILCLGEDDMITHETCTDKIPGDHASLDLSPGQEELLTALHQLGKPILVYLINGRPMNLNMVQQKADAILEGWYAGQEGADAAVDIIFGKVNPSGKLAVTFPKSIGQLPLYYNHKAGARLYDYVEMDGKPLYSFGYGLSYSTFEYSNLKLLSGIMKANGKITASVTIKNTGKRDGTEIVQLYIKDKISTTERPIMELKDFARVELKAGESKTISFTIDRSKLEYWTMNKKFEVEPGEFEAMVGASSADIRQKTMFKIQ